MNFRLKRLLSSVLALLLVMSTVIVGSPMTALAVGADTANEAKIGDTEYATLADAVKAVGNGTTATPTTITLLKDITINSQFIGHSYAQNIILDMNDHTVTSTGKAFTVYRTGTTFTIKNGTISGNTTGGTIQVTYGGKLVIGDDVTIKGAGGSATLVNVDNGSVDITAKNGVQFEGGKQDFKLSTNVNNKLNVAASIGRTYFGTLVDAFVAAQDGATIKVENAIAVDAMITNTKIVTLDLNGKIITGTDKTEKNFSLIDNRGTLTITGNGTMTLTATVNSGWNRYSAVIANNPGGKLIVENGTIEHLGGTDMAYGIDNLTNGKGTYAETVVNGGHIKSTYRAIRQFLNGVEAQNILTVNGGTVEGENKSIWSQDPSKNANSGTLAVGENATLIGDVYLFVTAGSTEWPVNVSIAAAALAEGSNVVTGNIPVEYTVKEVDGVYGVVTNAAEVVPPVSDDNVEVGGTAYETLAEAIAAAKDGDTVTLLKDLTIDSETYTIKDGVSIILDMNGKKITVTDNKTTNFELFYIYGGLTVTGNGTIELTATNNREWNASSSIFHNRGGVLNIENGSFTHKGGTDMAYVVDNSGNWYGDATTNIKGGELTSSYIAIRNRMEQNTHGASGVAYLNVFGGTITGVKRAIWAQAASTSTTSPASGEINVSGGDINGLIQTPAGNGSQCLTTISGGTVSAFQGEAGEFTVTGGVVEEITLLATDGNVAEAIVGKVGYSSFEDALANAQDGEIVTLLKDITLDNIVLTISKSITVDFNGYTVTVNFSGPDAEPERGNGEYAVKIESFMNITGGANVVLKDSTGNNGGLIADNQKWSLSSLITTAADSTLVIESGNYKQAYAVLGKGMIDTRGSDNVTVNGGNFYLGNVGSDSNGSPWIFNASGRNSGHINVNGGTFNADVFHQYYVFEVQTSADDGSLALRDNGDGTWTVVDAVAYVVEKHGKYEMNVGYTTLEEALDACVVTDGKVAYRANTYYKSNISESETIVLLKSVALENSVVVKAGQTVVLDLNGYNITGSSNLIVNNGDLTIKGEGEISLTFSGAVDNSKAVNTITNRGTLTVNDGKISNIGTGNQIGYAIDNYNGATLTVNGGEITASGSSYYDGIRLMCGSNETVVTVNGGTISSIWAQNPSDGKTKEVNGTVIVNGGTVTGAVYYENYTTVQVKDGVTVNVSTYGAGTAAEPVTENGYTVYSFVN